MLQVSEPMIFDIEGKQALNACAYMYGVLLTKLNVFVVGSCVCVFCLLAN